MPKPNLRDKVRAHLEAALDGLRRYDGRPYQANYLFDHLSDAYNVWLKFKPDHKMFLATDLYDLHDNLHGYLADYYTGEEDDLDFLVDKLEDIAHGMESCFDDAGVEERDWDLEYPYPFSEDENPVDAEPRRARGEGPGKYRLGEHFDGYEADVDTRPIALHRATTAEQRFFKLSRHKKRTTRQLAEIFRDNRRGGKAIIPSANVPARSMVTADSGGIELSKPEPEAVIPPFRDTKGIAEYFKWPHHGTAFPWGSENVQRGDLKIYYQLTATKGDLGNIKMEGLGRYGLNFSGRNINVLQLIDDFCESEPALERQLAKRLIHYARTGHSITEQQLYDAGIRRYLRKDRPKTRFAQLNRFAYLLCVKETARRKFAGAKYDLHNQPASTPDLPFGVAIAAALKLLADGHLRMHEVFDFNAPYGVFSGTQVTSRNMAITTDKFHRILALYNRVYGRECVTSETERLIVHENLEQLFQEQYPDGKVTATPEYYHRLLLEVFGGDSETSGDDYASSGGDLAEDYSGLLYGR